LTWRIKKDTYDIKMTDNKPVLDVVFYKTNSGNQPVKEWLKGQPKNARKIIGEDIKTVQYRWPLGMPTVRPLGKGLYEVRSSLPDKRIARVFFTIFENYMVLVHGFIKKTGRTPQREIDIARQRMK
jgi:phage-related protein